MARATRLRVATFNANSVRARLPIILEWLAQHRPDVLCLQETKVADAEFPQEAFNEAGYRVYFRGEKAHAGVAIATREEPDAVEFGFTRGTERDETRLARLTLRGVPIVNTYVPQGQSLESPMFAYKLKWFERLREFFAQHYKPTQPLIWVGDLNVAPEEIDLARPKDNQNHVCFHISVRQALRKVVQWGFVDVFRRHHPEPGHYTFWDYRFPTALAKNIGWRVDHILATRAATERCVACFIDKEPRLKPKPSDHTFVVADFTM